MFCTHEVAKDSSNAFKCVECGVSMYCNSVETAKARSGHVITVTYINNPIISWYVLFSAGVSRVGNTVGESGVRSTQVQVV